MLREWIGYFTFLMYLVSTLYNMRLMVYMEKAGLAELLLSVVFVVLLIIYISLSIKEKQCVVCGRITSMMVVLLLVNTFEFIYLNKVYESSSMMNFTIGLLLTICSSSIYGFTYLVEMNVILLVSLALCIGMISWLVMSKKQMTLLSDNLT